MVAESRYAPAVLILKELEIKQSAIALVETSKDCVPTALALVAFLLSVGGRPDPVPMGGVLTVSELNMSVLEWEVFLRQFLQSHDNVVCRGLGP